MNYITIFKEFLKNQFALSHLQANLTILSMITLFFQGIGFYFIDYDRMNKNSFVFLIIAGLVYNIFYFKTYLN
jgi:hypothetical protein